MIICDVVSEIESVQKKCKKRLIKLFLYIIRIPRTKKVKNKK